MAIAMTRDEELRAAKRRLVEVKAMVAEVIMIMTAEQALKAQRVVREAGRK